MGSPQLTFPWEAEMKRRSGKRAGSWAAASGILCCNWGHLTPDPPSRASGLDFAGSWPPSTYLTQAPGSSNLCLQEM